METTRVSGSPPASHSNLVYVALLIILLNLTAYPSFIVFAAGIASTSPQW
jgi:hypothetical protein